MQFKKAIFAICATTLTISASAATPATKNQQQINNYINMMVQTHHFKKQELEQLFAHFTPNQKIIDAMKSPYEAKPWTTYRKLFIQDNRINAGVTFWQAHKTELKQAQQQYGVPASVIVAIIGVETMYGKHTGKYSVFNSLATLAFNYPKRAKFFRYELTNYLLLSHEEQFPVLKAKGSYAGAMGIMQFMPSSIRKYAVGNLKNQLFTQDRAAIFSIANYLKSHGWQQGKPIATPIKHSVNPSWFSKNAKKFYSSQIINSAGISTPANITKASFINLPKDPNSNTWMVYKNFRAIMSYNPRIPYAMAVYQLSQKIADKMQHHG